MTDMQEPTTAKPSLEDIITLNWKYQMQGKRQDLRTRFSIVNEFVERWGPVIDQERQILASAPIDDTTKERRIELALAASKLTQAIKARKTLARELERRGEVQI